MNHKAVRRIVDLNVGSNVIGIDTTLSFSMQTKPQPTSVDI
jgi:hypothetical protein